LQQADATLTQSAHAERKWKLMVWGSSVAIANLITVSWHVMLLVKVEPSFPTVAIVLLILVNLLPVGGVFVFATGFPRCAAVMMILPLGVAFLIGGYTHFLSPGSGNVLRMRPGDLTFAFQASAVLLIVLEGVGCWIAVQILNYR
jgi:hypothetical protein